MRRWLAAAALACALGAASARAQPADPDPWFGPDKALHFGVSAGIAGAGYLLSYPWLPENEVGRLIVGGSAALAAGVAKELFDLTTGPGRPSWKDLTWDVAGTAAGLAVTWWLDVILFRPLIGILLTPRS